MSMIDPTIQLRPALEVREAAAKKLRQSAEQRSEVKAEESRSKAKPERPDTAQQVIQRVAERAIEHPPRDFQKLSASAAKFLLINLEPAMRLAEELRAESVKQSGTSVTDLLASDRQSQALSLLSD